jgi:hypothetical protein
MEENAARSHSLQVVHGNGLSNDTGMCEPPTSKRVGDNPVDEEVAKWPRKSFADVLSNLSESDTTPQHNATSSSSIVPSNIPASHEVGKRQHRSRSPPTKKEPNLALQMTEMLETMKVQQMQTSQTLQIMSQLLESVQNGTNGQASAPVQDPAPEPPASVQLPTLESSVEAQTTDNKKISPDLEAHFQKVNKQFDKKFKTYQNIFAKHDHISADISKMEGDTSFSTFPAGTKPFKFQTEEICLEKTLTEASDSNYIFQITIPRSSSRLQALKKIYFMSLLESKKIYCQAYNEHMAMLKTAVSKHEYLNALDAYQPPEEKTTDGLAAPQSTPVNIEVMAKKASKAYNDLLVAARDREKERQEAITAAQKLKEKEEKQKIDPPLALAEAVGQVVDQKFAPLKSAVDASLRSVPVDMDTSGEPAGQSSADSPANLDATKILQEACERIAPKQSPNGKGKGKKDKKGKGKGTDKKNEANSSPDNAKPKAKAKAKTKVKAKDQGQNNSPKNWESPPSRVGHNQKKARQNRYTTALDAWAMENMNKWYRYPYHQSQGRGGRW